MLVRVPSPPEVPSLAKQRAHSVPSSVHMPPPPLLCGVSPAGKPMTLKMRSNWSWWYGLLVLMSSCRQWKMGSDVRSSAKMQPMAQMSETDTQADRQAGRQRHTQTHTDRESTDDVYYLAG